MRSPFPTPNVNLAPFIQLPADVTFNGGGVPSNDVTQICSMDLGASVLEQYQAAAKKQGLTGNLSLVDGSKTGAFLQYNFGTSGLTIPLIQGTLIDSLGNAAVVNDFVAQLIYRYLFPFSPGKTNYGDTNYVEAGYGADAGDVPVPGCIVLQVLGSLCQGRWMAA